MSLQALVVKKSLTCIDLFSGCGGFTLGMMRSGFHELAAIDFDADAVEALRANLSNTHGKSCHESVIHG